MKANKKIIAICVLSLLVALCLSVVVFPGSSASHTFTAAPVIQDARLYLPVEQTLQEAGYEITERNKYFTAYVNKEDAIELRFDMTELRATKGNYSFDFQTDYMTHNNLLYIERQLLGALISRSILMDGDRVTLRGSDKSPYSWVTLSEGLVAHAGGGIQNIDYTNSPEALIENYAKGHRIFELDFRMTSDGYLACLHDWPANTPLTRDEFKKGKSRDYFTTMDYEDVIDFLAVNKDAYLVTDTKAFEDTPEDIQMQIKVLHDTAFRKDPDIMLRILVQIYNQDMLKIVRDVYPFDIIYTLYESRDTEAEVIRFVRNQQIKVVTMAPGRLNQAYLDAINRTGAKVYLHTINDMEEIKRYKDMGIWGFYTDFVMPNDMSAIR